jgi:hypothetical protein
MSPEDVERIVAGQVVFVKEEALKFDQDKPPLHLIDPLWLTTTAQVLAFGAKKYEAWNWAKGTFEWHRLYRAALGHMIAWYMGEDLDPESGLPHLWHANCCMMFLTRYVNDGMGTDTRPRFRNVNRGFTQRTHPESYDILQPLHNRPGSESEQTPDPGRGAGGEGGTPGNTLCGSERAGVGEALIRGGPEPGLDLHDQRVPDAPDEQQAKLADDIEWGVARAEQEGWTIPTFFYDWSPVEQRFWLDGTLGRSWRDAYHGGQQEVLLKN